MQPHIPLTSLRPGSMSEQAPRGEGTYLRHVRARKLGSPFPALTRLPWIHECSLTFLYNSFLQSKHQEIFSDWYRKSEVTQSRPTLCEPMDCSLTGFSVHGILKARIVEWVAILGIHYSRDRTQVSCIVGRYFIVWSTGEVIKFTMGAQEWSSSSLRLGSF